MSFSASGSEPISERPVHESEQQASKPKQQTPAPGNSTQRNLLEQILRQTALASVTEQSWDEAAMESLLQVARRYRGHPFELEPVAVELVHAALEHEFEMLASPSRDWRKISARVAETLFEDPVSHDQFEALWNKLLEAQ